MRIESLFVDNRPCADKSLAIGRIHKRRGSSKDRIGTALWDLLLATVEVPSLWKCSQEPSFEIPVLSHCEHSEAEDSRCQWSSCSSKNRSIAILALKVRLRLEETEPPVCICDAVTHSAGSFPKGSVHFPKDLETFVDNGVSRVDGVIGVQVLFAIILQTVS